MGAGAPGEGGFSTGRIALYIRVSTVDQNVDLQLRELHEYCARRGWRDRWEFVDQGLSGVDTKRPQLNAMLARIHSHEIRCVLTWRLDRLARSLSELVRLTNLFRENQVEFISLRNPGMDTTTAQGKLMFAIMGGFSEFERELIIERTRAGLAAARARGVHIGRPAAALDIEHMRHLRSMGLSMRQIAKSLHVSRTLVSRLLRKNDTLLLDRRGEDRDES